MKVLSQNIAQYQKKMKLGKNPLTCLTCT